MWPSYEDIKYFYDVNAYSNDDIKTYVQYGVLTEEQYKQTKSLLKG